MILALVGLVLLGGLAITQLQGDPVDWLTGEVVGTVHESGPPAAGETTR